MRVLCVTCTDKLRTNNKYTFAALCVKLLRFLPVSFVSKEVLYRVSAIIPWKSLLLFFKSQKLL